jgi:hypothetical protein
MQKIEFDEILSQREAQKVCEVRCVVDTKSVQYLITQAKDAPRYQFWHIAGDAYTCLHEFDAPPTMTCFKDHIANDITQRYNAPVSSMVCELYTLENYGRFTFTMSSVSFARRKSEEGHRILDIIVHTAMHPLDALGHALLYLHQ